MPLNHPVTLIMGNDPVEARLMNVSRDGMFVKTDTPLPEHATVRVQFLEQGTEVPCMAEGAVVWRGDFGVGIDLTTANDAFVAFVDRLAIAAATSHTAKRALLESLLYAPEIEISAQQPARR